MARYGVQYRGNRVRLSIMIGNIRLLTGLFEFSDGTKYHYLPNNCVGYQYNNNVQEILKLNGDIFGERLRLK